MSFPSEGGCGRAAARDRPRLHSHSRQMGHPSPEEVPSAAAHRGLAATDAERVRRALANSLADNTRSACLGHWRERDLFAGRVERIRRQGIAPGRSGRGHGPIPSMPTSRWPRASSWSPAGPATIRPATAGTRPGCAVRSFRGLARFPPPATARAEREGARRGRHRRLRCHRALSRTAGTVVQLAHEPAPARAWKMAKRTDSGVVSRQVLRPVRTSRKWGKALSAKRLAIRPE